MTDKEIIKAIENSIDEYDKTGIAVANNRIDKLILDLIMRQQAEIERLKIENQAFRSSANSYKLHYNEARAKAIKEFAKRLKERQVRICDCFEGVSIMDIDKLVNKMVGEE